MSIFLPRIKASRKPNEALQSEMKNRKRVFRVIFKSLHAKCRFICMRDLFSLWCEVNIYMHGGSWQWLSQTWLWGKSLPIEVISLDHTFPLALLSAKGSGTTSWATVDFFEGGFFLGLADKKLSLEYGEQMASRLHTRSYLQITRK